jgi:hypothetical protein
MNIKTLRVLQFSLIALISMSYCANTYAAVYQSPTDNVSFKSFNVSMADGKWKATGIIQRDSRNLVTIWAALDGGTMKEIGNQIKEDGSFYFTPSKYWKITDGAHNIQIEARPTWTDLDLKNNFAQASLATPTDNVSFKGFNVSLMADGKWKATGIIQRDSRNLVTIWAALDGGTMKEIGNQIKEDGSFYFTPSKYWSINNNSHTIEVEARTTWTDPDLGDNRSQAFFAYPVDNIKLSALGVKSLKVTGVVERDPRNLVTIWASLDGGTMKKIGNQIKEDGSFYFTLSNHWDISDGFHVINVEARSTWTDEYFYDNHRYLYYFKYTPGATPMDDVYIKNFDVSEVGGKQIATGVIQRDPCNSITLWTTAAGLGWKKVETQIGEDGSFSFVLSDYFDLSSFGNSFYGRSVIAVPNWGDPDFSNNYANDTHVAYPRHRY